MEVRDGTEEVLEITMSGASSLTKAASGNPTPYVWPGWRSVCAQDIYRTGEVTGR